MGLFDDVKIDYPLPEPAHNGYDYQTKDLECLMQRYTITEDGRLLQHAFHLEVVPGETRKIFGSEVSALTRVEDGDVEIPHHGDVFVYTSRAGVPTPEGWIEYRVRFTEGRVSSVVQIDYDGNVVGLRAAGGESNENHT